MKLLKHYVKPEVLSHTPIRFETTVSGRSHSKERFPGRGWGVDGRPPGHPGKFPGGGSTGGSFPGRGPYGHGKD